MTKDLVERVVQANPAYKFRVILFNGPPGVGKDTLALYAQSFDTRSRHVKFVSTMKMAVAHLFNYPIELMETAKDDKEYIKFGKTIREHQIAIGLAMRDIYGEEIFGRMLADRILGMPMQTPFVVVSDLGFTGELGPLKEAVGAERLTLFRLYQEGKTFDQDSRSYIRGENFGIKTFDVQNPFGKREEAKFMIKTYIESIIAERNNT